MYIDDISSAAMTSGGGSAFFYFDGPTPGASGDSYITLPQTVSEFGGGGPFTYEKTGYGKESA